jgi:hypothetical protein
MALGMAVQQQKRRTGLGADAGEDVARRRIDKVRCVTGIEVCERRHFTSRSNVGNGHNAGTIWSEENRYQSTKVYIPAHDFPAY